MSENTISHELPHTRSEIANEYACQRKIKLWIQHPEIPSSQVIPELHRQLMKGIESYQVKGLVPLSPGVYRDTDVSAEGRPNDYLNAFDVAPSMQKYCNDLDAKLRSEPSSPNAKLEETIHDASWAYFVFSRIHPYLDGNGRLGRMILKRVMSGRGYKDIIFQTNGAYGKERDEHLEAMNASDDTGNLAHLERYLLKQLKGRYVGSNDQDMIDRIDTLIQGKTESITTQKQRTSIADIWDGFKGLAINGILDNKK